MKILIVDDEELALSRLKRMLNELNFTQITLATNANDALEEIKKSHFDLAFLDINMPQKDGLQLGLELRYEAQNMPIIYQSAYNNHALEAYEIGAVGYIVKPYSLEQLKKSIENVIKLTKKDDFKILSKLGNSYTLLKPQDIYYVKADLSEVILRTKDDFSYYSQKISDLEVKLKSYNFLRIHRSYLINLDKIKEIQTHEQSRLSFTFNDINDEIDSSKDGAKLFRSIFKD